MRAKIKESARYLKIVEWSEEDQCFVGSAPGMIGRCCHGDDETAVYAELCTIVDEWVEIYKKEGKPLPQATAGKVYSGKFVLRTNPDLHQRLSVAAMQHGKSLNGYCVQILDHATLPSGMCVLNDDVEMKQTA